MDLSLQFCLFYHENSRLSYFLVGQLPLTKEIRGILTVENAAFIEKLCADDFRSEDDDDFR
jgi:hypothetical protein